MPLRQMQVDGRYFEIAMAEQDLNRAQVGAGLKKMCGEAVPQSVRMDVPVIRRATSSWLSTRPARSAAIWQALHRTLVVTGWLDVCQRLPGNSHSFGLRRRPRQQMRSASSR